MCNINCCYEFTLTLSINIAKYSIQVVKEDVLTKDKTTPTMSTTGHNTCIIPRFDFINLSFFISYLDF